MRETQGNELVRETLGNESFTLPLCPCSEQVRSFLSSEASALDSLAHRERRSELVRETRGNELERESQGNESELSLVEAVTIILSDDSFFFEVDDLLCFCTFQKW